MSSQEKMILADANANLAEVRNGALRTYASGSGNTAFGEQAIAQNRPFIQGVFSYNLVPTNFREFTSGSGSTGAESKMLKCSTGTSVGGYGAIQSFRSLNYKAGEGGLCRFTAIFESAVATSWQGVGLVNLGDELSFGFSGEDFGIWHRRGGLAEVRTLTITGGAGGSENATLTINGTGHTIALTSGTAAHNAYEVAAYVNASVAGWDADQLGDTVILSASSDGAKGGSYSFTSSTATGTVAQTTAGVDKTSTHIAEGDWNGETVSIDPTKGNVYQIRFQYLGFGNIFFEIEDPTTGEFRTVHTLRYANLNTTPSLGNPSLHFGMYCVSLGSTTDLIVRSASVGAFVQGFEGSIRNPRAVINTQTAVGTTFTNILTLRNRRTYNGYINQVEIQPMLLTLAGEGSKSTEFRVKATSTPGVEQNFANVGSNLVGDLDTTKATGLAGTVLASSVIAPGQGESIDLDALRVRVPPGLNLIVEARKISGAVQDISASLTYYEDI